MSRPFNDETFDLLRRIAIYLELHGEQKAAESVRRIADDPLVLDGAQ